MDDNLKKIIQRTNEQNTPLLDAMTLTVVWNMLLRVSEKTRILEILEAAFIPTSMDIIINDKELRKLIPHLPSLIDVETKGEGPEKLEACRAVAFEKSLDNTDRAQRILLIQSAIWYIIRHRMNQS